MNKLTYILSTVAFFTQLSLYGAIEYVVTPATYAEWDKIGAFVTALTGQSTSLHRITLTNDSDKDALFSYAMLEKQPIISSLGIDTLANSINTNVFVGGMIVSGLIGTGFCLYGKSVRDQLLAIAKTGGINNMPVAMATVPYFLTGTLSLLSTALMGVTYHKMASFKQSLVTFRKQLLPESVAIKAHSEVSYLMILN